MATHAQILANQANAAHSTGPRTDEGKQRSAQNALRGGYRAVHPVLPGESIDEFNDLLKSYHVEFQPATAAERHYVFQLADCEWRLARLAREEKHLIERELATLDGRDPLSLIAEATCRLYETSKTFVANQRYSQTFRGRHQRALSTLLRLRHEAERQLKALNYEVGEASALVGPSRLLAGARLSFLKRTNEANYARPGDAKNAFVKTAPAGPTQTDQKKPVNTASEASKPQRTNPTPEFEDNSLQVHQLADKIGAGNSL